ncbi:hypothetical protein HHI36_012004 [Cryptolaemus montrouzieri]|uniref:Peptidase S1 domain-containing protein n=1 Tax=Cryptolaemus montrouzieri TaxID=559131 RepID=A0ABD2NDB5_9CUCU
MEIFMILFVISAVADYQKVIGENQISFRIIDGFETDITEFPHQVSIVFNGSHHCGGSIIAPKYILTAAHCTHKVPAFFFIVRVGSSNINRGGRMHSVARVFTHPKFTVKFENDVAVLRLRRAVRYGHNVKPIQLAEENDKLPPPGTKALVSGWGRTISNGTKMAPHLMALEVPIIAHEKCEELYSEKSYVIDEKMFCAGYEEGGADSCIGDSGGAFLVDGVQHGIVSWGVGCGLKRRPGVYASVAKLRKFIRDMSGV